jgi:hypothetical protein
LATRLSQFLKEAPGLKPLVGRLERIGQLQRIYNETVPPVLARASRIGSIEGTTLIIIAFSGTVAAGLKQRLPSLLLQMQATEPQVTAIRVDVQPEPTSVNNSKKHGLTLSSVARQSLNSLQATLPDSALKTALQRLLRDDGKQDKKLD